MEFEEVKKLRDECHKCRKCSIGGIGIGGKISNVFSNMNPDADIMIVGQNPGADEIKQGSPFVGISGKTFDSLLMETLKMDRGRLYISNVVRCFTPGNRKPYQPEISNCLPFLDREVEMVFPALIVTLGAPAFTQLTGMTGITKHRAKVIFSIKYRVPIFPMVHPSPFNTASKKGRKEFCSDLKVLGKIIEKIDSGEKLF